MTRCTWRARSGSTDTARSGCGNCSSCTGRVSAAADYMVWVHRRSGFQLRGVQPPYGGIGAERQALDGRRSCSRWLDQAACSGWQRTNGGGSGRSSSGISSRRAGLAAAVGNTQWRPGVQSEVAVKGLLGGEGPLARLFGASVLLPAELHAQQLPAMKSEFYIRRAKPAVS